MSLVIMGKEVKEISLKPKEIVFDKKGKKTAYADSKGKGVNKIQVQASEYKWVYDDGENYEGKEYKCIKGKPVKPFSRTTLIDKYDTIDKSETKYFVNNELTYLLVNQSFKDDIKALNDENKCISFKYVIRGFKIYKAVVSYDADMDKVFMRCYRGNIKQLDLNENETKSTIECDDEVETMDLNELEV